jgi:ATP-dependent RNA circularization protein (DNA/RNA ligase family)
MFEAEKLILPEFPSTPHITVRELKELMKTHDVSFEEKLDGANCGMALYDGEAIIRNRKHILRKGYKKGTKAKDQFLGVWGWFYDHKKMFEDLAEYGSLSMYGEWLAYTHVVHYDGLPSLFIAYDLYDWENKRFLTCSERDFILNALDVYQPVGYNQSILDNYNTELSAFSSSEQIEGVYCRARSRDNLTLETRYKLVRDGFKQIEWLDSPIQKNKLIR